MANILVLGGVTYDDLVYLDHFPERRPQTIFSKKQHATVGGTGAGKALNLNRLGHDVTLHALVGDDSPGQSVRHYFHNERLRFEAVRDSNGTERHINLMDGQGDRISIYVNPATFEPDIDLTRLENLIANCDVAVVNIINYCRHALPIAKTHNKPTWIDIHDYDGQSDYHQDFIEGADYLFMSSDQMPDYRPFMQQVIDVGKQLVVCTHGKDGATALSERGWATVPALPAKVVDTNGAGDSFFSGFLHGYLQGKTVETCMHYGARTAPIMCYLH